MRGRREDVGGLALFQDGSVGHDDEVVGDVSRELHLVRHHDHGHAVVGEFPHHVQHLQAQFGVERGGGLVEEHHLGVEGQGARDGDALLLSA
ncbi:hypothetical protein [Streptomyces sp. TRM68416]|uniref:hypothetical protein n=1 Tax=Streptomyces sp. TRM68416 TaxID=2758412 RepID=UPI002948B912|nr:hypothetical protein [Streptomyces sp. TRM68416]